MILLTASKAAQARRDSYFIDKRKYSVQANVRTGSFGQFHPFLRAAFKASEQTIVSIDGHFLRADGTYPFILKNGALRTREKRYNSDIVAWHSEANVSHSFNNTSDLNIKAYYYIVGPTPCCGGLGLSLMPRRA